MYFRWVRRVEGVDASGGIKRCIFSVCISMMTFLIMTTYYLITFL